MAIAALVLGILTFVCLGPIAGILAIIFGILGMKKAAEIGNGRGMAIAGIVLGAVGTVVSIIVLIIVIAAANDTSDSIRDAFDDISGPASTADYDISPETCKIDNSGGVTYDGTIENTGSRDLSFEIVADIRDANSDVILSSPNTYVDVPEGDTVKWEITDYLSDPADITCEVSGVNNWFN
jgi:hypothetical protein